MPGRRHAQDGRTIATVGGGDQYGSILHESVRTPRC
jgi:hypothetical protein